MPKDRITRFLDLIEGASHDELAEMVHEALNALPVERAVLACVEWADLSEQLVEMRDAVFEAMDAGGP